MGFTVAEDKIVEIDAIADPERVRTITATVLTDEWPHGKPAAPGRVAASSEPRHAERHNGHRAKRPSQSVSSGTATGRWLWPHRSGRSARDSNRDRCGYHPRQIDPSFLSRLTWLPGW
jgi:hypothetical protein